MLLFYEILLLLFELNLSTTNQKELEDFTKTNAIHEIKGKQKWN